MILVAATHGASHVPRSDIGSCAIKAQFSFLQYVTSDPVWCAESVRIGW
jgi:hypothetical protein